MGASGNMVMAALYELLPDKSLFQNKMEKLGFPGVSIEYAESTKCGITGTHISIKIDGIEDMSYDFHGHSDSHNHEHHHEHEHSHDHSDSCSRSRRYSYKEILELIQDLEVSERVKNDAVNVYSIIGKAEAHVHGTPLDEIHFHEVGSIDAVVDVIGCSLLMEMLEVTDVTASPIHVGFGMVRCEHGILPVPAPATAEILKDIPIYNGRIEGELCTPTGAALLRHFVSEFSEMFPMLVKKIGYGMGTKDFEAANCLRVFLYENAVPTRQGDGSTIFSDDVYEISCNLDDMTPEAIGAVFELLLENGALDVYTTPIMMKKNRPAVMLTCLCTFDMHDAIAALIIKHTTTLGVRTIKYQRTKMKRTVETVNTEYGEIRIKIAEGFGIKKQKPEYDDVLEASKKHGVPFHRVYEAVNKN